MKHIDADILKATMRSHGICVLIPTYNNVGTVRRVVMETLGYCDDVIVVNDGSTDGTREILAAIPEIDVVDYPKNAGKGTALKRGFRHALSRGFRYAVTLDSDGQHYPEDIEHLVRAVVEMPGALIVGERDLSKVDINAKSSFANKFSNFWFCLQTGIGLKDTQTGFRAYPLFRLHGLNLLTSRYEAELELLVFSAWYGTPICPVPIRVYYPPQKERVSHFRPALDFTRISILNTVLCILALVYGLPMRIYNALSQRKLFACDFRPFTHRDGLRRDAAITFGRLGRSLFGVVYFLFWSVVVFTPMTAIYFSIGKNTETKRLRFHRMLQWLSAHFLRMLPGAKVRYENLNDTTFSSPAIVVCNHQSFLDLPILMAMHPKLIFLTNDRVWHNPYYGRVIHCAEFLPVSAGIDTILPRLRSLRDRGYSIVVFPEGTRSEDCTILPFRQGAFHLARELQMDILSMVLHGAGHFMPKKGKLFRKGDIVLRILPRVQYCPRHSTTRTEARVYRKMIGEMYHKLVCERENCRYFRNDVLYRYAYRGWATVARCKAMLRHMPEYAEVIDQGVPEWVMHGVPKRVMHGSSEEVMHGSSEASAVHRSVRIINSGIGVFPLLYALVNKDVEVYAFEECLADYNIAKETAALPRNLHYVHAVWEGDYTVEGISFDRTIIMDGFTPQII